MEAFQAGAAEMVLAKGGFDGWRAAQFAYLLPE
jgi:hypothetical protein